MIWKAHIGWNMGTFGYVRQIYSFMVNLRSYGYCSYSSRLN